MTRFASERARSLTRFWRGSRLRPPGGSGEPAEPKSNATARCGNGLHRRPPGRGGGRPAADVGANDDSAKHAADHGAAMYGEMAAVGLRQTVIGVRFKPSEAVVIQDKRLLDRIIPNALDARLRVVLASIRTRRGRSRRVSEPGALRVVRIRGRPGLSRGQAVRDRQRAQPAGVLAPPVHALRHERLRGDVRAVPRGRVRLPEGIDSGIQVVGIGLSPRGNDKPNAKSNVSTSPVRFVRALGAWYRASGRTRPLMDAFSFHPYPNKATDPLERGYGWPNAGFVNLDRVKQALWDAFDGTAQPTTLNGLRLHLDEVGWQVDTSRFTGYQGRENVPVTDELTQAAIYGDLIRRSACDQDVHEVSFFGFRDDGLRTGFQAALQRADGTPRPAVAAVRAAIAETASGCSGAPSVWSPAEDVLGADAELSVSSSGIVGAVISAGEERGRRRA